MGTLYFCCITCWFGASHARAGPFDLKSKPQLFEHLTRLFNDLFIVIYLFTFLPFFIINFYLIIKIIIILK